MYFEKIEELNFFIISKIFWAHCVLSYPILPIFTNNAEWRQILKLSKLEFFPYLQFLVNYMGKSRRV